MECVLNSCCFLLEFCSEFSRCEPNYWHIFSKPGRAEPGNQATRQARQPGSQSCCDVCCLNLSWAVWLLRSGACLGWSRFVLGKVSAGLCAWSLGFDSPHHPHHPPQPHKPPPTHPATCVRAHPLGISGKHCWSTTQRSFSTRFLDYCLFSPN